MVHVKKCPLVAEGIVAQRGRPSCEFYDGEKKIIYCYGYADAFNDEPLEECKHCLDWNRSEQVQIDLHRSRNNRTMNFIVDETGIYMAVDECIKKLVLPKEVFVEAYQKYIEDVYGNEKEKRNEKF